MAIQRGTVVLGYHGANAYQVAPLPDGIVDGDLLVAAIGDRYLPSLPAGWVSVHSASGTNQSGRLAYKVVTSADVGAGTFTYTLAGVGTGSYAVVAFEAGSYRVADPIASWTDSVLASMLEAMPYLVINAGQSVYHYANGRTAEPGVVVGSAGTLLDRREADPDSESALYAELATSDTTVNISWDATTAANGAYKASFVVQDPVGTTTLSGLSGTAAMLVARYDVVAISPLSDEFLLNTAPELTVLADGTPSPFSVQFATSASAAFATTLWNQTITGAVPGQVSTTVGVALQPNKTSYWRARAGDGTSWGPWSTPQQLNPYLERSNGQEYLHANVGGELASIQHGLDYMHVNAGFERVLSPNAGDYLHLNVGFEVILKRIGGDYLHLNTTTGVPVPHLWFAWLDHGFVNDHVWIYGQGLGSVLTEFHAQMRILDSNNGIEQSVSVFDWSVNPAGPHAYDSQRRIYPGTDGVDPDVNVQVTVVEITIPTGVASPAAIIDYFLARTDGGVSNKIPYLLYPLIPLPLGVAQGNTRSGSALRVSTGQETAEPLQQLRATFAPQEITVLGGMLERPPQTLVTSRSTFTFTGGTSTADLGDPVDTPVPLSARWRGLSASVEPRPDLGTGVSLWTPVSGSANAWRLLNGTEPYVDEEYAVLSRQDRIERPAMIFPGDAWGELTTALPNGPGQPEFTIAMVAVLHPSQNTTPSDGSTEVSSSTIFATKLDTAQPADTFPMALVLHGSTIYARFGPNRNNFLSLDIPGDYLGTRPVIISFSTGRRLANAVSPTEAPVGRLSLLTNSLTTVSGAHLRMAASTRLYLGRDPVPDHEMRMEVLDLAVGARLTPAQEVALISALDGAYGVSGA